jgi:CRP-like cAMP-binding protein
MLARLERRGPLDKHDREAVLALSHKVQTAAARQYLVRAGERPSRCFVLLQGFAFRRKIVGAGCRQIVGVHLTGDLVDFQNALLETTDENVQALTEAKVAALPTAEIAALIGGSPTIAKAVLKEALIDAAIFSE